MSDQTTVEGTLLDVKYYDDQSGWGIFRVALDQGRKAIIKGNLSEPKEGLYLVAEGTWQSDKYGQHLKASSIFPSTPKGKDATLRFLEELPNVGPSTAKKIYDKLGDNAIEKILESPDNLNDIPRLRKGDIQTIVAALEEHGDNLAVEQELVGLGLGPITRSKITQHFTDNLKEILATDTYRLTEVSGIAFPSLDTKIIQSGKLSPTHPSRVLAATAYALAEACNSKGHTCLTPDDTLTAVHKLGVTCDHTAFEAAVEQLVTKGNLIQLPDLRLAPADLYQAEKQIARKLTSLLQSKTDPVPAIIPEDLNEQQAQGVRNALENRVSILTGGPGTGKTYTLRAILDCMKGEYVYLCAPTGKAAKRMTEATGCEASTMHYLLAMLQYGKGKLPPNCTIILDECSMIGVALMAEFLNAISPSHSPLARLILVGDDDQLPSINPGSFLQDTLQSKIIPTVKLTQLMRQSQNSLIARNAAQIRQGKKLIYPQKGEQTDFPFSPDKHGLQYMLKLLKHRVPQLRRANGQPYDPFRDIQLLSPVYRGDWGCHNINARLQELYNPPCKGKTEFKRHKKDTFSFREGDKVIITKNNREANVVNGDIGILTKISLTGFRATFHIALDDRSVVLENDHLNSVQLAYCITVHKAQGSEAPMVICIFAKSTPPLMRQRNMLYTATTRAREMLWLIGDKYTIQQCIENNQPNHRQTLLKEFLLATS